METIKKLCEELGFPTEAEFALYRAYDLILQNPKAQSLLQENACLLWANKLQSRDDLSRLDQIAELTGIHPYTVYLLFFILAVPEMRKRYEEKKLDPSLCHDCLMDLKWKLNETHEIYGVWGVFCGDWYPDFFLLKRFALGRLQFEDRPLGFDYEIGTLMLHSTDNVLHVHIPSSGPLYYNEVLDSYARAAAFFRPDCKDRPIVFMCDSWVLHPPVQALFPAGNLRRFTQDYTYVRSFTDPRQDDRWRVFHMPNSTPINEYPEDTTLQRNLKAWLLQGNHMELGIGVLLYQNGTIL